MTTAKIVWDPMGDDGNYLEIGNDLTMKQFMFQERVSFWADIYKDILGDYAYLFD